MNAGYDSGPLVGDADLIIVIESDAPWYPRVATARRGLPRRAYRRGPDLCALSDALVPDRSLDRRAGRASCSTALDAALAKKTLDVDARRAKLIERHQARRAKADKEARAQTLNTATFSRAVGEAVGEDAVIFNEYPLCARLIARARSRARSTASRPRAGSAGVSAPRSARSSRRRRSSSSRPIGDGAYMFANPTVCHWVADKFDLPVLTVIFNNSALRRGAARDALDVQGRRRGRGRRPVPRRPVALAAVRGIRARAGRPRRARRDIRRTGALPLPARATPCAAASRRSSTFSFPN